MDAWKKASGIGPTASVGRGTGPARIGPTQDPFGGMKFDRITETAGTREKLKRFLPDQLVDLLVPEVKAEDFVFRDQTNNDVVDVGGTAGVIKRSNMFRNSTPRVVGWDQNKAAMIKRELSKLPRLGESIDGVYNIPIAGNIHGQAFQNVEAVHNLYDPITKTDDLSIRPVRKERLNKKSDVNNDIITYPRNDHPDIGPLDNRYIRSRIEIDDAKTQDMHGLEGTVHHELTHAAQHAFRGANERAQRRAALIHRYGPYTLRDEEIGARATARHRQTKAIFKEDPAVYGTKPPSYRESVREELFSKKDWYNNDVEDLPYADLFKRNVTDDSLRAVTNVSPDVYTNPKFKMLPETEQFQHPSVQRHIELNNFLGKQDPFEVVRSIRNATLRTAGQLIGAEKRHDRIQRAIATSLDKKAFQNLSKSNPTYTDDYAFKAQELINKLTDRKWLEQETNKRLEKSLMRQEKRQEHPVVRFRDWKRLMKSMAMGKK